MASNNKIHFKSIDELIDSSLNEKIASNEFVEEIPVDEFIGNDSVMNDATTSRRDFLKILGFSTAAVTLAACEAPITKSIPYLTNPNDGLIPAIPGIPNYYATTYFSGYDFANILVKTREGRPIKIEPNKQAQFGSTNARAQASVLTLYDTDKVKNPKIKNGNSFETSDWKAIDNFVIKGLNNAQASAKKIVILTSSFPSPSTKLIINNFKTKYPTTETVVYDAISNSNILDATETVFGKRILPMYDVAKAKVIVSFQADFLNENSFGVSEQDYAKAKTPGKDMVKHIQVETNLSLTGASADLRFPVKPSESYRILAELYKALNGSSSDKTANKIAKELLKGGTNSVVLVDGDKDACILGYLINQKLNSEILIKDQAITASEANDLIFNNFIADLEASKIEVLINFNANPVYSHSESERIEKAIQKVPCSVYLTEKENETANSFKAIAPVPHWMECWGDFQLSTKNISLIQPVIQKIYDTRSFQDSLLKWSGASEDFYTILKQNWQTSILPKLGYTFNQALYNGANLTSDSETLTFASVDSNPILNKFSNPKKSEFELQLYTKSSIGDGAQANNPWLQELPDGITRVSWDNYLTINPLDATKLGLSNEFDGKMAIDGSLVNIVVYGINLQNVPVFVQPGQAIGTFGLALGYGQKIKRDREIEDKFKCAEVGVNAYKVYKNSLKSHSISKIEPTGEMHQFACMQMQNTLMGRYEIAREVSNNDYINKDSNEWNEPLKMHSYTKEMPINKVQLWQEFDSSTGHRFNLSVDMNSCTGCGACIISCQAENNVPVVGKEEVRRSRDMYWLRIDRYYSTDIPITLQDSITDGKNEPQQYKELIVPAAENPNVIFQPVMCQHCNHAPCETVCPVAATSHGKQGQNQMAYNRCVGTRYCANNCPYKVRRFNWFNYAQNDKFDYHMNNDLGRMVLNPDVVTRTRGVMEKCSMCIQMTQKTILEAKKEGRKIEAGEFQTACTNACSSGALQFGDVNNPEDKIVELAKDKRKYILLEDIGAKPNVFYQYKVRNN